MVLKMENRILELLIIQKKTRILYPKLYEDFKNDETISFKYSPRIEDEKEYLQILENFYK